MKFNIIGDIHGRPNWKDLVITDGVNVFTGDYFSPYERISFEAQRDNFMDIIKFKEAHPETILLIGNHDEDHWHIRERYSRHDFVHCNEIAELFNENKDYLQIAYSADNKLLISHSGVSFAWYERYKGCNNVKEVKPVYTVYVLTSDNALTIEEAFDKYLNQWKKNRSPFEKLNFNGPKKANDSLYIWNGVFYKYNNDSFNAIEEYTPDDIADEINRLWKCGIYSAFNFENNSYPNDTYGESSIQSPIWIRPDSLVSYNIFRYSDKYYQCVGHTQMYNPVYNKTHRIAFTDCLGQTTACIQFDSSSEKFEINRLGDVLFTNVKN